MDLRSRSTVLIAAAAVTFLAGLTAGRVVSSSPQAESGDVAAPESPDATSTTRDKSPAPPPTRFTQTREGAVEAATSYGLRLDGPVVLDEPSRSALLRDNASDGARATVAIWATGVVLADGQPLAMPEWRTTEVELVWERDDWRLVGFTSRPGPAPSLAGDGSGHGVAAQIKAFTPYSLTVAEPSAGATR